MNRLIPLPDLYSIIVQITEPTKVTTKIFRTDSFKYFITKRVYSI